MELETLKEIFKDQRQHIAIGKILKTSLTNDQSTLKAVVEVWPEQREVIATVAWGAIGPNAGVISFPLAGDMVLLAFAEGDDDLIYVIGRLTTKEDRLPTNALYGDTVLKSLEAKALWITATMGELFISRGDSQPNENLVLGQQLKNLFIDILTQLKELSDKVSTHTHAGNLGYPTSAPNEAADFINIGSQFDNLKSSPVEDETILSDFAFTEKGSE